MEQEFPIAIAPETVIHLITSLATPTLSCRSPERVLTLLGTDLLECIYWRVGSLMYMYCHTLMEEDGRRKEVNECLIEQVGEDLYIAGQSSVSLILSLNLLSSLVLSLSLSLSLFTFLILFLPPFLPHH